MAELSERFIAHFQSAFLNFKTASSLRKREQVLKLLTQADRLTGSREGLEYLYTQTEALTDAGIFHQTPWADPAKLIPTLVKGTFQSGFPNSVYELLSELRLLMMAEAGGSKRRFKLSPSEAEAVLEDILVENLEFAFRDLSEQSRSMMSKTEQEKAFLLFEFLFERTELKGIKVKLAEEIRLICDQRPILTRKVRNIIKTVYNKFELSSDSETDKGLMFYADALYRPSVLSGHFPDRHEYKEKLASQSEDMLLMEAEALSEYMLGTGLVSPYLAALLLFCIENEKNYLVPKVLGLEARGKAEWNKFTDTLIKLIKKAVSTDHYQSVYGLTRMMERGLFSRRSVRIGLKNLMTVRLHPEIRKMILKSLSRKGKDDSAEALQYLLGATVRVLGQPLGIGQGNNSTCQSARGISMWSRHSPAKLINMITTVATQNNLIFRFENDTLESVKLVKGLLDKPDYSLDAVSVILVPHLDKIYNEMMRLAFGRGEDPHKWVNPELYGHWIQVGFASAYDALSNSIQDYKGFSRIFYAAFHPEYNRGREMVYPNPVGIFVTGSRGDMLGFHAVSLLRVKKDGNGEIRAYFLNPNNEGRQNWGQGIKPSVSGKGERHGESSLPFEQFLSRIYAFHYNSLEVKNNLAGVPNQVLESCEQLARESWGRSYTWSELKKQW